MQRGYLWLHVHADGAVFGNGGIEGQPHAEFAKHDGDGSGIAAALQNRDWKLAAYQKAGFFTIGSDQVWLGQDLKQIAALQRLNQSAQVEVRPECKDVESIGNVERGGQVKVGAVDTRHWRSRGSGKLTGCNSTGRISRPGGNQIDRELAGRAPVKLGELDPQENLLFYGR